MKTKRSIVWGGKTLAVATGVVALAVMTMVAGCGKPTTTQTVKPETKAPPKTTAIVPTEMVNRPAPNFSVVDVNGKTHTLGDYKGKILVVDFWASYCKPCVKKLSEYQQFYDKYGARGVEFLGLSMDESNDVIKGWQKENSEVSFPLARLDQKTQQAFFGNTKLVPIPQTRVIDRQGLVRFSFGPDASSEAVEQAIKMLLQPAGH